MILQLPDYGQHIILLGSTGSGKSNLAQAMIQNFGRTFIIDTQDSLDVPGSMFKNPKYLKNELWLYNQLHYVPKLTYRKRAWWNWILTTIADSSSKRKPHPRIVYIDEIYHLGIGPSFPDALPVSVSVCRQRQISFWISTQRPKLIPVATITEASRIFVFYLTRGDDVDYVSTFARRDKKGFKQALLDQQKDFSFIEIDNWMGTWRKYNKLGG